MSAPPDERTLCAIPPGTWTEIRALAGDPGLCARLAELGFTPGEWIRCVASAPFGGPVSVAMRGTIFALRRAEAACVVVEEAGPSGAAAR